MPYFDMDEYSLDLYLEDPDGKKFARFFGFLYIAITSSIFILPFVSSSDEHPNNTGDAKQNNTENIINIDTVRNSIMDTIKIKPKIKE